MSKSLCEYPYGSIADVFSEKLYKEKFKAWGWRKNLSGPVASWMTQKADQRKRDSGKDTVFSYGGLQWNTSQAQKSASRSKKARTEIISGEYVVKITRVFSNLELVETPAEVTYTTPRDNVLSPRNALPAGESNKQSLELIVLSDTEDDSSGSEHDVPILPTSWHGYTISDVVAVFASARRSAGQGNPEKAIADFSTALEGYQHLLGPTHEDTAKVAFAMASFYTEQNRSTDADQIIQDICRSYIVKFGIEHRRTQQLIMQIVELLTGWNRDDDASTFLTRVEELEEGSPDRFASLSTQRRSRKRKSRARSKASRSQPTALSSMLTDEAQEMIAENDPARITRGLEMVRVHVAAKNEAVESFLITIIDHCWHRPNFEIQAIRARGELLKYYNKLLNRTERRAAFLNAAQASMDVIIWQNWDKKFFKSFEVMEALLELGACILKGGYGAEAANIFRAVELKAEDSFGWDQERTLWAKLTIGIIYQRYSGWEAAKLWFEYALAASVAANGEEDGITIALETAMENHRFSYLSDEGRPFKSIFGVCGVVIRPSRLHLD